MWMTFSASRRQTVDDASERLWHVAVVAEPYRRMARVLCAVCKPSDRAVCDAEWIAIGGSAASAFENAIEPATKPATNVRFIALPHMLDTAPVCALPL
jgi:hypothetical protein